MVRKKIYTKEHILKATWEVVATEGFSGFTARNIAKKMGISTQPIYLEFKNMNDLKETLLEEIYKYLADEIFPQKVTGDTVFDLGINYIRFAQKEHRLYVALFIEDYGGGQKMHDFSSNYFEQLIKNHPKYQHLSSEYIEALHTNLWITVTGMSTLMSSGIISPTDEQIVDMMQEVIDRILESKRIIHINT